MAKVLIDTDSVATVSKGMDTLSNNVNTILGSVKSYDVANQDFDFSGAKAPIVNNIEGIETKVSNTNVLLDTVVKVHSELQESVGNVDSGNAVVGNSNVAAAISGVRSASNYSSSSSSDDYYATATDQVVETVAAENVDENQQVVETTADEKATALIDGNVTEEEEVIGLVDEKATDAEVSNRVVSSIVGEMYKEVLNETKIEETTISNLISAIKNGEMCVVVEGNSFDLKTVEYLRVVAKAAMPVHAVIRFVKLDNILDFKTNSTASDLTEDAKNVLKEDKENDKKAKEEKVESLNYSVKDRVLLDSLNSIKCAKGIEISYEQLPITLIIKNNTVLSFKRGIISEDELRKELLRINVIPTVN